MFDFLKFYFLYLSTISRRIVLSLLAVVMFVGYFLITDPDMEIIKELPFGTQLLLLMSMFFMGAMVIAFIETYTDIYTDDIAKDEKRIANAALESPEGSGYILIAKSIRILAYSIIMAAIVFSVNGIL